MNSFHWQITIMATWFKLLLALFIGLVAFKFRVPSAKSSSSESGDNDDNEKENLTIAWIYKPPYVGGPDNSSLDNQGHGIVRDAILRYVWWDCSADRYEITNLRAESESGMIQMLKQNKVHIAIPIFEQQKSTKVLWIYLFQITGLSWYGIHSFGQRWKRRSWCRFRFCIEVLAIACFHHDHDLHGHCWNHHVGTVKIKFISTAVLWDKFECMVAKLKCSHISIYPYRSVSFKKFQGFFEPTKWKQMLPTRCFKLIPNPYFKQLWSHPIYLFKLVNSTECNLAYPSPLPIKSQIV